MCTVGVPFDSTSYIIIRINAEFIRNNILVKGKSISIQNFKLIICFQIYSAKTCQAQIVEFFEKSLTKVAL
jgi:hypothetical protein